MKIIVNPHDIQIRKSEKVNENEYKITKCEFEFSEEYTNDLVKVAIFSNSVGAYKQYIINNECDIPNEVLGVQESTLLGVYAYKEENDELILRYSPEPIKFYINKGSYVKNAENTEPITPTDKEQIEQMLANINIDAEKVGKITTITYVNKDGIERQVTLEDGESLENMEIVNRDLYVTYGGNTSDLGQIEPNVQVGTTTTVSPSSQARVTNTGTTLNPVFNFEIPKGEAGSIKFEIVEQLPATGSDDTIYLVPYTKVTVQELPTENIQLHTIYIVESTGKRYVYNGNEWIEISSDNQYIEYIYINNQWEELGSIGVDINLDDYYTKSETNTLLNNKVGFTDYASGGTAGVMKISNTYFAGVNSNGTLYALSRSYQQYLDGNELGFISKSTLENVITGKGLIDKTVNDLTNYTTTSDMNTLLGNKLDTSKVVNASSTTAGETYDVRYINGLVGDINSALDTINGEVI